ncbi:ParB/RepB/Spo0J family partition protein [Leifsonia sp. McL0607]|uniref:ParB/RepB/Spo0J family partition protein n=1 Tax=Leifsonia sp. McL0607 TaxID=3415672 RepID=UPI003CF09BBE
MTITTNQTAVAHHAEQAVTVPDTAADAARGSLRHVDPNSIVIETNARTLPILSEEWIAELKANGVMTPVSGWLNEAGEVVVRAGQRRVLGARAAGLTTVPVYLTIQSQKTADRIVDQVIENEQREAMSSSDLAAAYQQLSFEGLNLTTIAKRLSKKREEVKTGLAVAQNQQAAAAVIDYQLTLDQAAVLIEFEDDEEARTTLIRVATTAPTQFAHEAQRQRDRRARADRKAKLIADLTGRGFVHLTSSGYDDDKKVLLPIADLTKDGNPATAEDVADLPGRSFRLDWNDKPVLYVNGWKEAGFKKARTTVTAPMTDEQKTERRELIANNKAWDSAEVVRREWLTTVVRKAKLPSDAARFAATGLTTYSGEVYRAMQEQSALAHTLLGIEQDKSGYFAGDNIGGWVAAHPTKAQHATLAVVLGGIESGTSRNTWRSPRQNDAAYFRQLATWGYPLSEVEQLLIDRFEATKKKPRTSRKPAATES